MQLYSTFSICLNEMRIDSMRRLKIMTDDMPMASGDVFGVNNMLDVLRAFCEEQSVEMPAVRLIEEDDVLWPYAVPLHLVKNGQMDQFDAEVIFLLRDFPERENRQAEACRLSVMAEEFGRPCLLTTRAAYSPQQDIFYRSFSFMKMPITWEDEAGREYEVFLKGQLETGSLANLMKHVEYIGKKIIYHNEL